MSESLLQILNEPIDAVRRRERSALDDLLRTRNNRVVLFGCGNLGRQTAKALRDIGISPLAFSDNNQARWGTQIDGLEVLPPMKAVELYGKNATFLVTIWNVLHWYRDTFRQLSSYGADQIAPYVLVHWRFSEIFLPFLLNDLPHKLYEERDAVLAAAGIWADEESRSTYEASVKMRALGDLNELPGKPEENTYFPREIFRMDSNDSLVDCGAFDGDTIRQVLESAAGNLPTIHAIEADSISFARLQECVNRLPAAARERIHLYRCAVGLERGTIHFESSGTVDSKISETGELVDIYPIDELFRDEPVSFIKMDIEGAEFDALRGAAKVIERDKPILAICVYHTQNDIWRLPLLIREMLPEHRFFLRAYEGDGFQTVVYAVPPRRMVVRAAA
jgi:FkbM family methyltransferase